MERSVDRYLHKKFKKQLSIEPSNNANKADDRHEGADSVTGKASERNSNESVPKFSTNESSLKVTVVDTSSDKSSISDERKQAGDPQSSNSCISYVISTSRVEPEIHYRANFDTRFNEPIPTAETSSILDNAYSKQYVTSKLVSVDKGDISSSSVGNPEDPEKAEPKDSQPEPVEKSTGGKYICSYCNLACSKPSVLQKHIRAHTNERPYPCVSCGFSFKTRSNLYKHCRSRTHANRVMGNKVQEIHSEDTDSQSKIEYMDIGEPGEDMAKVEEKIVQDIKTKPYKPRFHTAATFFEEKEGEDQKVPETVHKPSNSDLLSLHINEVINKNNAIVNSNEPYLLKKRPIDNSQDNTNNNEVYSQPQDERHSDEPLNLTKSRKRCMSEAGEPGIHTSLIKELLLKNLYADSMQCPHCKMIFQTVTELELHKMRSCKGYQKTGARYSRSSSVNVASILTKNKNAFDSIPHLQNTVFPQKSPGPFLGKTRLVDSDKTKSFSFDDGLTTLQSNFRNSTDLLKTTLKYTISPLTTQDKKKTAVKMFGGEVKITQTTGETRSFKIDSKDSEHFTEYGGRLSENRVVKSSLQSGGTVLQNKPTYPKQDPLRSSPDVIRVYDNTTLSPSIDIVNLEKTKFNFDRLQGELDEKSDRVRPSADVIGSSTLGTPSTSYKYTNIMDFSQKAVKLLAPNLKQPNLAIPGIPMPNQIVMPRSPALALEVKADQKYEQPVSRAETVLKTQEPEVRNLENIQFAQKQILLQQKMGAEPPLSNQSLCNPVNLLVNGKVVRYVPGIPGPVAAEVVADVPYRANYRSHKPNMRVNYPEAPNTPMETEPIPEKLEPRVPYTPDKKFPEPERISKSPKFPLETKTSDMKSPAPKSESKSPVSSTSSSTLGETPRKFSRPSTLALKPSLAAHKQHHGLTPTMFNQILISPDTPRVAKKYMQHFLHGNYFSYLGLKSSTKSVYCTLNKTQPCYVQHFKKLSMYSEWRQQDNKADKLYVSAFDSRQKQQKYVTAGKASADLVVHSSYKFVVTESSSSKSDENQKANSILGGYESNEDYTYVRGRGRGRYVCDQCGIRCKKPSMLKKHIRTHTNDRPYTCSHCNFSFKTKGNLTKHMKSKAHTKNYAANSSSSGSSTQQSGTQSSESDTDDSGMDSSDESTRQQEHEAAYGLLSLSQKTSQNISQSDFSSTSAVGSIAAGENVSFMNTEQVTQVNNSNFARNKILDQQVTINFNSKAIEAPSTSADSDSKEMRNLLQFLGKTNTNRPLTYPYTSDMVEDTKEVSSPASSVSYEKTERLPVPYKHEIVLSPKVAEGKKGIPITISYDPNYLEDTSASKMPQTPILKVNDRVVLNNISYNNMPVDARKRKVQEPDNSSAKLHRMNSEPEAMDLSMPSLEEKPAEVIRYNGNSPTKETELRISNLHLGETRILPHPDTVVRNRNFDPSYKYDNFKSNGGAFDEQNREINLKTNSVNESKININYVIQENHPTVITFTEGSNSFSSMEYDNSAMETLADVATKQVKLEKNTLAKSVASEYLKLATKHEMQTDGIREAGNYVPAAKEVNELVKPEENKSCTICAKNFSKPSQLRLHMNIHYLERPFRCDPCSISFRTKGHLQKHERSASHHNKLSSSPLLSSSEPRPFKCSDCNIAFRIHGHLAKHLRSKMHIMKLECLAKIPFGLYAELERANSLLTEINTTDGNQCLESLKALARKVFMNDPNKLNQLEVSSLSSADASDS